MHSENIKSLLLSVMIELQKIASVLAPPIYHFASCALSVLLSDNPRLLSPSPSFRLPKMATMDSAGSPPAPPVNHEPKDDASSQAQTDKKAIKSSSKKTTRAGAPNYSPDDITALLDCVEAEEPLESNHWAVVTKKFALWAAANSRLERDQDSLKNKFDKLANMKKKTGDPSCPLPVRRAKFIARAIHNKCAAMTLGDSSDGDSNTGNEVTPCTVLSEGTSEENSEDGVVGVCKKKRKTGATVTPTKTKTEHASLEYVGHMTQHIGAISETIRMRSLSSSVSKADVLSIVKQEVKESMKPTHELLLKMNGMLETLSSNQSQ